MRLSDHIHDFSTPVPRDLDAYLKPSLFLTYLCFWLPKTQNLTNSNIDCHNSKHSPSNQYHTHIYNSEVIDYRRQTSSSNHQRDIKHQFQRLGSLHPPIISINRLLESKRVQATKLELLRILCLLPCLA